MRSPQSVANGITFARLFVSPVNVWCILEGRFVLSSAIFIFAVVSDVFDGIFARREPSPSRIGAVLDHSTDCFFVSSALFALAIHRSVPLLLPILVVLAFIQYVLDSRVLQKEQLVPSKLGRWNGIGYFVIVGVVVGENALNVDWPSNLWIRQTFAWVLVASTILSIGARLFLLGRRSTSEKS